MIKSLNVFRNVVEVTLRTNAVMTELYLAAYLLLPGYGLEQRTKNR